jgi:predicted dehydrogenase
MYLAILGTDPDMLALIAAARSLGHTIVWLGDVRPDDAAAVRASVPDVVPSTAWETLLDHATADAVLVGRGTAGDEMRAEQLKRMATDSVPLLVIHPICGSVLTYYELDMIRRETGGILRHYNPLLGDPTIAEIADWASGQDSRIGAVHQVSCERIAANGRRETLLNALARDVELLAAVAGNIRKVSAVGPREANASFATLQVQMTAEIPASLRWSVAPPSEHESGVDFALVREHGYLKFQVSDSAADSRAITWSSEDTQDSQVKLTTSPPFDAPAAAIEQLAAAVAESDPQRRAAASTWDKATQAMEVLEAIELSLEKGRTMEVHQQQLTEQLAFRGTMSALGCGLLLIGFAVLAFAAFLGLFEAPNERQQLFPNWSIVLLAVLTFFLLLQTVPLLASKRDRSQSAADTNDGSEP